MSATVVVMVGTDHHRFDRLIEWVDEAAADLPHVRFIVQHGASRAPRVAAGSAHWSQCEVQALLAQADVVVCHGGPGAIADARGAGHLPICVPRDPRLGEHVDAHQQRFAAVASESGIVRTAATPEELRAAVAELLDSRSRRTAPTLDDSETLLARKRLAAVLDELLEAAPARRRSVRVLARP